MCKRLTNNPPTEKTIARVLMDNAVEKRLRVLNLRSSSPAGRVDVAIILVRIIWNTYDCPPPVRESGLVEKRTADGEAGFGKFIEALLVAAV